MIALYNQMKLVLGHKKRPVVFQLLCNGAGGGDGVGDGVASPCQWFPTLKNPCPK